MKLTYSGISLYRSKILAKHDKEHYELTFLDSFSPLRIELSHIRIISLVSPSNNDYCIISILQRHDVCLSRVLPLKNFNVICPHVILLKMLNIRVTNFVTAELSEHLYFSPESSQCHSLICALKID